MSRQSEQNVEQSLREAHAWVLRLEEAGGSAFDQWRFRQWLAQDPQHADAYDRALTAVQAFGHLSRADIDNDLLPMSDVAEGQPRDTSRSSRFGFAGLAVAAALILTFTTTLVIRSNDGLSPSPAVPTYAATFETVSGESQQVVLQDGSTVSLGPESVLSVKYFASSRQLILERGLGFFDVAKDASRPFSVSTDSLVATAVGTAFDVRNSAGVFRVAVAEGTVDVSYPLTTNYSQSDARLQERLVAGDTVAANRKDGLQSPVSTSADDVGAWRQQRWVYRGASIAEFVADLDRNSAATIKIEDPTHLLSDLRISGVFRGADTEEHLSALASIHPVSIERPADGLVLIQPRN